MWRRSDFATSVTTGACESSRARTCGSLRGGGPGLAGGAERDERGVPQLQLPRRGAGEELGVLGHGPGPATLDVADPQRVEVAGDGELVGHRVADPLPLGTVAQRRVVDVEGVAEGGAGRDGAGGHQGSWWWMRVIGQQKRPLAGARGLRVGSGELADAPADNDHVEVRHGRSVTRPIPPRHIPVPHPETSIVRLPSGLQESHIHATRLHESGFPDVEASSTKPRHSSERPRRGRSPSDDRPRGFDRTSPHCPSTGRIPDRRRSSARPASLRAVPERTVYRRCLEGGPWQRVLPGIVMLFTGHPTVDQLVHAALLLCGPDAMVTGMEACRRHGLRRGPARRGDTGTVDRDPRTRTGEQAGSLCRVRARRTHVQRSRCRFCGTACRSHPWCAHARTRHAGSARLPR